MKQATMRDSADKFGKIGILANFSLSASIRDANVCFAFPLITASSVFLQELPMLNLLRWIPAQLRRLQTQSGLPRKAIRKFVSTRLTLERLEDRITPAIDTWTGGSLVNANWSSVGNWSTT